jgi:hypothetical protein
MNRDWDLIRDILLRVEQADKGVELKDFSGYDEALVAHQVQILDDAGLIEAKINVMFGGTVWFRISRLTWEGHEFLDATRNDTIWRRTKDRIQKEGLGMAIDVIKGVAVKLSLGSLGF